MHTNVVLRKWGYIQVQGASQTILHLAIHQIHLSTISMLSSLRIYSVLSFLFVLLMAVVAGTSLRSIAEEQLMVLTEKNNVSLTNGYVNDVWNKYSDTLNGLSPVESSTWKDRAEIKNFAYDTVRYFKGADILRINIYTATGALLLSIPGDGNAKVQNKHQLPATYPSLRPAIAVDMGMQLLQTHIVNDVELKNAAQEKITGNIAQTIIGLPSPHALKNEAKIDGVLEVISDVTGQSGNIIKLQMASTGSIILVFLLLMILLFLVSRKAESIITKQHEANAELAAAAAAAQAENRDKSQFLANVSHELRTPLNAIIGFSEIIKSEMMGQIDNERYHGYIDDIHSAGVHLLSLINDILDFSKAEAGKFEFEVDEMNANKAVANCLRIVGARAEGGGVILNDALPKDPVIMVCDSKRFKQIMLNLLSNAIKFTPAGGEVRVSAWQNIMDDTCSFEVKDSGIGISPKDISRAMAAFGQVDNSLKRKYEGTGLGLPLTKKFVELMGGKFEITSEVNVGTTIVFTLPRIVRQLEGAIVKQAE